VCLQEGDELADKTIYELNYPELVGYCWGVECGGRGRGFNIVCVSVKEGDESADKTIYELYYPELVYWGGGG